jgi:uncharacterized protein (TIGR03435 family)
MMTELSLVAKTTILLGAALLAVLAARRATASLRSLILTSAFVVVLILPIAAWTLPALTVNVPALDAAPVISAPPAALGPAWRVSAYPIALLAASRPVATIAPSLANTLRLLWMLGALVFLVRTVASLRRLGHIRRSGQPWPNADLAAVLGRLGRPQVRVFLHPELAVPIACGFLRPAIGFPADATQWTRDDLTRALTHELQHVRRHDWPIQCLAKVACAVYWFHPLVWVAWRKLRLEAEHACDDAVVRTDDRTAYAQLLVRLARRIVEQSGTPAVAMADSSSLARRISAVLDPEHPRAEMRMASAVVTVVVAVALAAGVASLRAQSIKREPVDLRAIPTSVDLFFESATVRPSTGGEETQSFETDTGRFIARNQTLRSLVTAAYSPLAPSPDAFAWTAIDMRVSGGPDWLDKDRFNIDAITGRSVSIPELQTMTRRLLADHFNLFVHVEKSDKPAYRLVRARPGGQLGAGLRPAPTPCTTGAPEKEGGPGRMEYRCMPMAIFVANPGVIEVMGRPVLDRTGLTGAFDISLIYAPTDSELETIYETPRWEVPPALLARPTIFAAVEQQLGLRLESTRATVEEGLVVDYAQHPTPNP